MPTRTRRLDRLTAEQLAQLPAIRDEWLAIGLSTERADRAAALAGVHKAYAAAKLPPPAIVVWLDSPLQGVIGAEYLKRLLERLASGASDQVGDQVWGQVRDQVGGQVRDQVWGQVGDQVGGQVRDQVWDQVRDQVWGQVRDQVYQSIWGQQEAGWLAFYDAIGRFGLADITHPLDGLAEVARAAGWWWPFRGAVLLTERPMAIHRDERNRLHATDGPALVYPDGFGVWAWHGVRVEPWVTATPADEITAAQVTGERNQEVRRVLVERIGAERYMALAGGKIVARDDWGTLWEATTPLPMRVVEVLNSTPEPDGSSKTYWLRVPETTERRDEDRCVACGADLAIVPSTPHAAIAWVYSVCDAHYQPAVMS